MPLKETCLGAPGVDLTSRPADSGQAWEPVTWSGRGSDVYYPVVTTGAAAIRPSIAGVVSMARSAYVPPSADYTARFKLFIASYTSAAQVFLRLTSDPRIEDVSAYQVQYNALATPGEWEFTKTLAGTNSTLAAAVQVTYTAGSTHDCLLSVAGSAPVTLTLTVDGSLVNTWTDSSSPLTAAGSIGLDFFSSDTPSDVTGVQVSLIESPAQADGSTGTAAGSSTAAGVGAGGAPPASGSLAGAIGSAFRASGPLVALATGGLFHSTAGDTADPAVPYVVFDVMSEPIELITSDSRWGATSITFDAVASTEAAADAVADALLAAFSGPDGDTGITLAFDGGSTTPLVLEDRSQGAWHSRGRGSSRIFKSCLRYLARTRLVAGP